VTVEEILAALQALIDGAQTEDGEERPLTEEEQQQVEQLEVALASAQHDRELRNRHRARTAMVRPDLAVHASGTEQVSEELRAFHHYAMTGQMETRAITTGVDAAGGYLVPDSTSTKIVERLKAFGGLMNEAENITTATGEPMNWATEDDTANTAEIVAEGAAAASAGADKAFGTANLAVYKYEATGAGNLPMKVSWEFLQDSPINFENHIADNFARRIARKFSVDICVGTGTGQPLGIVTPQTAFDEIASNVAGPTYGELVGAVAAIDPEYEGGAKWLMDPATWWGLVTNLLDANDRPLIQAQAQSGAGTAIAKQLLGYEVILDPGMPAIGDQTKAIVFGNLRQSYVVRKVGGFSLLRLNELYAINGFVGFLGWARMGGTVQNLNSYVVLGGENTA
jgi:HK97 family phage major capsid protein